MGNNFSSSSDESVGVTGSNQTEPLQLDTSCSNPQMVVAATLVKAVINLEKERQKGRQLCLDDESVSQWWAPYGFHLKQEMVLRDPHDGSIFGAIFHWNAGVGVGAGDPPPKFVIAFRGTMLRKATSKEDIANDFNYIFFNGLHESTRVDMGLTAVKVILEKVGENSILLAGHSLGAAIALVIGRNLVLTMRCYLDTYLFNPPILSLQLDSCNPVQMVKNSLKSGMVALSSCLDKKMVGMEEIVALSKWMPRLFINEFDWICKEYLTHFEDLKKMEKSCAGREEDWTVSMNSFKTLVSNLFGGNHSHPSYLIPSAHLTTNSWHPQGLMAPHRLRQWLNPDLQQLRHQRYQSFQAS